MNILYIPFHENEDTDLMTLARLWQLNRVIKPQIIIHRQDIDERLLDGETLTIFILAHGMGFDGENYQVYSHSTTGPHLNTISITEVARRFAYDFQYFASKVGQINLYFCNDRGSEKRVAQNFIDKLTTFDNLDIRYFRGKLLTAYNNELNAIIGNQTVPLDKVTSLINLKQVPRLNIDSVTLNYKPTTARFGIQKELSMLYRKLERKRERRLQALWQKRMELNTNGQKPMEGIRYSSDTNGQKPMEGILYRSDTRGQKTMQVRMQALRGKRRQALRDKQMQILRDKRRQILRKELMEGRDNLVRHPVNNNIASSNRHSFFNTQPERALPKIGDLLYTSQTNI